MALGSSRIHVPESELPDLKYLAYTEIGAFEAIEETLQHLAPSIDSDTLSRQIARESSLGYAAVSRILQILWRLSIIQRRFELDTEAFMEAISSSLGHLKEDWTETDAESWKERVPYIAALLASDGVISFCAKAGELIIEQPTTFCRARLVTDIRPIFDEKAEMIRGFVPFHTIVITAHEGGESKEIYMALDSNDLVQLRRQLERAEQKETMLRGHLDIAGYVVVETKSEDKHE